MVKKLAHHICCLIFRSVPSSLFVFLASGVINPRRLSTIHPKHRILMDNQQIFFPFNFIVSLGQVFHVSSSCFRSSAHRMAVYPFMRANTEIFIQTLPIFSISILE